MDGEQDSLTLPLFNDILKQDEFYDSGDSLVTQGFQGRIDFRCQGRRRNETKTDRMGVVYGEDNRLCWRVIDPMPRAIVSTCIYKIVSILNFYLSILQMYIYYQSIFLLYLHYMHPYFIFIHPFSSMYIHSSFYLSIHSFFR